VFLTEAEKNGELCRQNLLNRPSEIPAYWAKLTVVMGYPAKIAGTVLA
jgi:hypothetical protein